MHFILADGSYLKPYRPSVDLWYRPHIKNIFKKRALFRYLNIEDRLVSA